jgi:hypothetical protein
VPLVGPTAPLDANEPRASPGARVGVVRQRRATPLLT